MKQRTIKRFGWTPDLPDNRDLVFEGLRITKLPDAIDLRSHCPPIQDQGNLGSCTANAIAAAFDFQRKLQNYPFITPSRLFIYFNERDMEGTVDFDSGAQIRDGIKSVVNQGVCLESDWPYDIARFTEKPTPLAYSLAEKNQALQYRRISNSLASMLNCLAGGLPFVFGFSVYESFTDGEVENTGVLPIPQSGESVIGGHAVMCVGYSRPDRWFIVRNSYGTSWGKDGYYTMPMDYLTNPNLCDDRWVISKVEI